MMILVKLARGWYFKNNGLCYLLLINSKRYMRLESALRTYHGPWFLAELSSLLETEKEVIRRITDKNRVFVSAQWKKGELSSFEVVRDNKLIFKISESMIYKKAVYKK